MWVPKYLTFPSDVKITTIHGRKYLCSCFSAKYVQILDLNPSYPVFYNVANPTAHISSLWVHFGRCDVYS